MFKHPPEQKSIFDPVLLRAALRDAVKKLDPRLLWRNPVMLCVEIASIITVLTFIMSLLGAGREPVWFTGQVSLWLWLTVLFATFAEALAEGRGKARAASLRSSRTELLSTACEEAARLNRFVGNLLDMTRLEAGAMRLKYTPCDVEELIGCALSVLDPRLGKREIAVHLAPDLPPVPLDMGCMTQVLVNLLDNSLKYSPSDRPIAINARIDREWLVIEVVDHGSGVAEADLDRIFDKFHRVPAPEGVRGTGLGLSICKGFVQAHGGKIRASITTGGGLTVTIRLPLVPPSQIEEPAHA